MRKPKHHYSSRNTHIWEGKYRICKITKIQKKIDFWPFWPKCKSRYQKWRNEWGFNLRYATKKLRYFYRIQKLTGKSIMKIKTKTLTCENLEKYHNWHAKSVKNCKKTIAFYRFFWKKNVDFLEEYRHFIPPPNLSTDGGPWFWGQRRKHFKNRCLRRFWHFSVSWIDWGGYKMSIFFEKSSITPKKNTIKLQEFWQKKW